MSWVEDFSFDDAEPVWPNPVRTEYVQAVLLLFDDHHPDAVREWLRGQLGLQEGAFKGRTWVGFPTALEKLARAGDRAALVLCAGDVIHELGRRDTGPVPATTDAWATIMQAADVTFREHGFTSNPDRGLWNRVGADGYRAIVAVVRSRNSNRGNRIFWFNYGLVLPGSETAARSARRRLVELRFADRFGPVPYRRTLEFRYDLAMGVLFQRLPGIEIGPHDYGFPVSRTQFLRELGETAALLARGDDEHFRERVLMSLDPWRVVEPVEWQRAVARQRGRVYDWQLAAVHAQRDYGDLRGAWHNAWTLVHEVVGEHRYLFPATQDPNEAAAHQTLAELTDVLTALDPPGLPIDAADARVLDAWTESVRRAPNGTIWYGDVPERPAAEVEEVIRVADRVLGSFSAQCYALGAK